MPANPVVVPTLRVGYLRHDLLAATRSGNPKRFLRAIAAFALPSRWPSPRSTREAVQDAGVVRGDPAAARAVEAELASSPPARRPRTPEALRRARALDVLATEAPAGAIVERTVAAFLRGDLAPPASAAEAEAPALLAAEAAAEAAALREAGHTRPVVVATFPGFHPNPYAALMESAYRGRGLAAIHVRDTASIEAIVAAKDVPREGGGSSYDVVVHVNAPDRFVGAVAAEAEAPAMAAEALQLIDGWIDRGATVVASIHNGPRLTGPRGAAERIVAQGIVDRAALVHVLTASTPSRLADWISIDPRGVVHVPHPSYDGAIGPLPSRAEARARAELEAGPDEPIVIGLIGSLVARKGCLELLDAFDRLPAELPDRRPRRLLLAGAPAGPQAEEIIRRALATPAVIARLGYVADAELPELLATLDVAVVPYVDLLNSGWLHLALTAGIPVIAPSGSTAEEVVDPAALLTYDGGDPASLARAIGGAGALTSAAARAAARRSVAGLSGEALSARFVEAVLAAMGR